ncbi:MAG: cytidylate kinase-like family protein [Gracilibacteraceae bacterium]|jgi:cytidylate kinase|nr:cytidylate kinase-like family protein [Gracilibacteraceae bacterium]
MEQYCVTIAREFGSGGRLIGQLLAEKLGVAFYDRELIELAAVETGFAAEYIKEVEHRKTSRLCFAFPAHNLPGASAFTAGAGVSVPITDQVFLAQSSIIQRLAAEKSCVIVGRNADYVLRDKVCCARVFIYAPLEYRVLFARKHYNETRSDLDSYIKRQDKNRREYCSYFTQRKWGASFNYHLCLDSSIGLEPSVHVLLAFVAEFMRRFT